MEPSHRRGISRLVRVVGRRFHLNGGLRRKEAFNTLTAVEDARRWYILFSADTVVCV